MRASVIAALLALGAAAPGAAEQGGSILDPDDGQAQVLESCALREVQKGPGHALDLCLGQLANSCMHSPRGMTTNGSIECMQGETGAWDRILNAAWKGLREDASARDADPAPGAPQVSEAQLAAQRAWLAFRDAECAHLHAEWSPGTIAGQIAAHCRMSMTAERAIALRLRLSQNRER